MGHFAAPMSRNGGVSALSIALLDKSDFSAGGFAAEYGNAQSAVLDMHFRKGNPNQQAYSFRFGLIGIDFSAEGPIQRGQSSFWLIIAILLWGCFLSLGSMWSVLMWPILFRIYLLI